MHLQISIMNASQRFKHDSSVCHELCMLLATKFGMIGRQMEILLKIAGMQTKALLETSTYM